MPNYSNGKIYKLECHSTGKVYIGSTTDALCKRKSGHEIHYKYFQSGKYHYVSSFEILKNRNYDIYLIEAFPCNNKEELHAREGYHIKMIDCVNKIIAGRTKKEYRTDNKEAILKYKKQYRTENKEAVLKYENQYRTDNKDKIKQYRVENKDKIKQYRIENKEKINEKHNCQCCGKYTTVNKTRHEKTKKHQEYFKTQIN